MWAPSVCWKAVPGTIQTPPTSTRCLKKKSILCRYDWSYNAMPWDLMQTFRLRSGVGATCVLENTAWNDTDATYRPPCDSVRGPRSATPQPVIGTSGRASPYLDPSKLLLHSDYTGYVCINYTIIIWSGQMSLAGCGI